MTIVCAVLAAGESQRLGFPKQLLPWANATNLVQHAVDCAQQTQCARVGVVVGAHAASVKRTLFGRRVEFIPSDWQLGLSASVRAAALWARSTRASALLLCVCDQPYLSAEHLMRLIARSRFGGQLAASRYAGNAAVPALFPLNYLDHLLRLEGDQGASALLSAANETALVDWPDGEFDIDTASDIARAAARAWPERRAWALASLKQSQI